MSSYGTEGDTSGDVSGSTLRDSAKVRKALAKHWMFDALGWSSVILFLGFLVEAPPGLLTKVGRFWLTIQHGVSDLYLVPFALAALTILLKLQQARAAATLIPLVLLPEMDAEQLAQGRAQVKSMRRLNGVLQGVFVGSLVAAFLGVVLTILLYVTHAGMPFSWTTTATHIMAWFVLKYWEESSTTWVLPEEVRLRSSPDAKRLLKLARRNPKPGLRSWRGYPEDNTFIALLEHLTHLRTQGVKLNE